MYALLPAFQKDISEYSTLSSLYSDILADITVPVTIKTLISYKKAYIPAKVQILNDGIQAATSVLSMYPNVLKLINEVVDDKDRKSNTFRWHE